MIAHHPIHELGVSEKLLGDWIFGIEFRRPSGRNLCLFVTLLVAEPRVRRLDSPELLPEVAEGVVDVDGVREQRGNGEAAA